MEIKEISTAKDEKKWHNYVFNCSDATVYHTLEWRDILFQEYKFKPVYLMAMEDEKVVGVLPMFFVRNLTGKKLISLPFSQFGGPLADNVIVLEFLIAKSKDICKTLRCKNLIFKSYTPINNTIVDKLNLVERKDFIICRLILNKAFDYLKNNFSRNKKRSVEKCLNAGIKTRFADSLSDIEYLYDIELKLRKRQGSPIPSSNYFKRQWNTLFNKGLLKAILAEINSHIIAGEIFFCFHNYLMNIYSISNDDYKNLSPITLIHWREIQWATENGFEYLDFGITDKKSNGIIEFKTKWGTENFNSSYFYYPGLLDLDSTAKEGVIYNIFVKIWSKLPCSVIKLLGPFIIKHFG